MNFKLGAIYVLDSKFQRVLAGIQKSCNNISIAKLLIILYVQLLLSGGIMRILKLTLIAILIISFSQLNAQDVRKESMFISGMVGSFSSGAPSNAIEGTKNAAFGAGFGFRLFSDVFFYSRVMYQLKSDFTAYDQVQFLDQDLQVVDELQQVNASFSQLVMNTGLQYNIYLYSDLTLGVNGGVTYSIVNQEAFGLGGQAINSLNNEGVFGYFGGASLEKRFEERDLAAFVEVQYNNAANNAINFRNRLSGVNFTVGGRYYFSDR